MHHPFNLVPVLQTGLKSLYDDVRICCFGDRCEKKLNSTLPLKFSKSIWT